MATSKSKSPTKAKQPPQNTSTAQPGNDVDVSATGAAPAAPQASLPQAGNPSGETKAVPPPGELVSAGTSVAAAVVAPASLPAMASLSKEAKTPGSKKKDVVATALIVSSKVEGFRRAGRAWSKAKDTVSIDEFTTEQVEALLGESMLDVVVVAE